jgi:hypothetical protein
MVNTNMTHVFKHPKYYTELRKRNKSDQAISLKTHDGECERAPDSGLKLQATSSKLKGTSCSSDKTQAGPGARRKPQAPSSRVQAPSHKRQAS